MSGKGKKRTGNGEIDVDVYTFMVQKMAITNPNHFSAECSDECWAGLPQHPTRRRDPLRRENDLKKTTGSVLI
jgi:hypothetical protein